ncbi:MAG TPA: hypothetical protein VF653_20095 [Methylomirabilota bacterium]
MPGLLLHLALGSLWLSLVTAAPAAAAPIDVRYAEGVTHGFLVVRAIDGDVLGEGDLLQVLRPPGHPQGQEGVESRLVLRFRDGSLYEETARFSQQRVFTLLGYSLRQRGPTFPMELDVSLTREGDKGRYQARSRVPGEEDQQDSGVVDMPADVYSGMLTTLVKNLARGARETVHVLAFGPKPMLVQVEMAPAGDERISAGERRVSATHFVLTPNLGLVRGTIARIIGKNPAPYHCWIVTGDVPAFVNIDGALFPGGPVWRIETVSPRPPARGSAGR